MEIRRREQAPALQGRREESADEVSALEGMARFRLRLPTPCRRQGYVRLRRMLHLPLQRDQEKAAAPPTLINTQSSHAPKTTTKALVREIFLGLTMVSPSAAKKLL